MTDLFPEEKEALKFFKNMDLDVKPIQTSKEKSAEFFINGDKRGYVVEVKARRNSEAWEKEIRSGGVALDTKPTGYARWAEDVSRKAIKQFESVDPNHFRWWVTWFSIECNSSEDAMFQQAIGSLFGTRQIVDLATQKMWDCIYTTPGVYERHQQIVATIVTQFDSITMCVNELADDYSSFVESKLYKSFERIGPVNSASNLVKDRNFLEVDRNLVNRKDEKAITTYITKKYGIETPVLINMKAHTASTRV